MGSNNPKGSRASLLGQMSKERALRTADWVAEFLSVTRDWVDRATKSGTLPFIPVGDEVRFDPDAIKAWGRGQAPSRSSRLPPPPLTQQAAATDAVPQLSDSAAPLLEALSADVKALAAARPVQEVHTVAEAAQILRCHRTQVYKLIKKGKLQTAPKVSKGALILRSSLLAFLGSAPPSAPRARAPRTKAWSADGLEKLRI